MLQCTVYNGMLPVFYASTNVTGVVNTESNAQFVARKRKKTIMVSPVRPDELVLDRAS